VENFILFIWILFGFFNFNLILIFVTSNLILFLNIFLKLFYCEKTNKNIFFKERGTELERAIQREKMNEV
jgi:hypothetical protein